MKRLAFCIVFVAGCTTATLPEDPGERVWLAGVLAIPDGAATDPRCGGATLTVGSKRGVECSRVLVGPRPLVIYLHGCGGPQQDHHIEMFRRLGYVVVAPDSTASGREITCPTKIYSVLARHQEIDDAVEKTTAWPWVDRSRLVLAGHSEGGIATALYARPGVVRAKIIMGWTCTAGSDAYHGLRGVDPALSFVFDRDPWNVQNRGDCGSAMRPPSKSVVFPGSEHDVVMYHRDRVSNEIGSFLRAVLADAR